jgi:hypothetical protein
MKASKTQQNLTFRPKPLTIEQRNAVDLLITGATDADVAAAVGVDRTTVWIWRTTAPQFMAAVEEARLEVWRGPQEKLRSLAMKAVENLAEKVEAGDIRCSLEVLKAMGLYGCVSHIGQTDPEKILKAQAEAQMQREGIPEDATDAMLINMTKNDAYLRRLAEVTADLRAEFGEPE